MSFMTRSSMLSLDARDLPDGTPTVAAIQISVSTAGATNPPKLSSQLFQDLCNIPGIRVLQDSHSNTTVVVPTR
jgi:hypothetical protein